MLAHAAEIPEADLGDLIGAGRAGRGRTARPFLVAVDGVTDPGNLGAIIRTCDAAGVTGVLLPKRRAVHVTPTVAKSAAGAVEYVPMALVPGLPARASPADRARHLDRRPRRWCRSRALRHRFARHRADLSGVGCRGRLGLVALGARAICDSIVGIPMAGHVSSLNVSAAAAVSLYEVSRLRLTRP